MTVSVCWQYQIKKALREQALVVPLEQSAKETCILPIDWAIARDFIIKYEWIGNMGNSKYCFGLFLAKRLACVVCYGPPVAPSRYKTILGKDLAKSMLRLPVTYLHLHQTGKATKFP